MNAPRFLRFLLAVLVTVGLAIAPVVLPAAAGNRASDADIQMTGMSGDMPCCPGEGKHKGCQDCPLVAICMLKVLQDGPSATILSMREVNSWTLRPSDEPEIIGLRKPPPDQPPRMIV
jgi:hypothetical protein